MEAQVILLICITLAAFPLHQKLQNLNIVIKNCWVETPKSKKNTSNMAKNLC